MIGRAISDWREHFLLAFFFAHNYLGCWNPERHWGCG